MPAVLLPLFISRGPFGPTYVTCLLLPLFLLAPFVLPAVTTQSFLAVTDPFRTAVRVTCYLHLERGFLPNRLSLN
jgi:hypothetical protein